MPRGMCVQSVPSTGHLACQHSLAHMCVLLQVIRTSSDSPPQYNATMNCIFAAQKDVSVKLRTRWKFCCEPRYSHVTSICYLMCVSPTYIIICLHIHNFMHVYCICLHINDVQICPLFEWRSVGQITFWATSMSNGLQWFKHTTGSKLHMYCPKIVRSQYDKMNNNGTLSPPETYNAHLFQCRVIQ